MGERAVAGILAWLDFGALVTTSYASATIQVEGGGVVANAKDGDAEDVYWDVETTGMSTSDAGGTGLQTAEMTGERARSSMAGLDFKEMWRTVDGGIRNFRARLSLAILRGPW